MIFDPLVIIAIIAGGLLWLLAGGGVIWFGIYCIRKPLFDLPNVGDIAMGAGAILVGILILVVPPLMIKYPAPDRPCVRYETTYQYNAATKTTMPVRYCAQYGEWVKP